MHIVKFKCKTKYQIQSNDLHLKKFIQRRYNHTNKIQNKILNHCKVKETPANEPFRKKKTKEKEISKMNTKVKHN